MQVDCAWCVATHDRQSPHFYALCDTPFQTPTYSSGFFYVQDERYAAGAGMRRSGVYQFCTVCRGRRDAQERRVSVLHGIPICGAKPVRTAPWPRPASRPVPGLTFSDPPRHGYLSPATRFKRIPASLGRRLPVGSRSQGGGTRTPARFGWVLVEKLAWVMRTTAGMQEVEHQK